MTLARLGKPKGEWNMVKGFEKAYAEYERLRELACEPCEPEIIRAEKEYEPDGYSMEYTYNCQECENKECEYWGDYNDTRDE
jgi:hypothetical protein